MINQPQPEETAPKVLRSAAGYYIGTQCPSTEIPGLIEPGRRLSGYFRSEAAAQKELDSRNREDDEEE